MCSIFWLFFDFTLFLEYAISKSDDCDEKLESGFNELVTAAAKTYPIVAIRPQSSVKGSVGGSAS
jgi:hypothetical protein